MDGREVYRFATHNVPESIERSTQKASLDLDQIDYYLLHQANSRIITQVAKRLEQPLEKFPINIDEYGNTAAASEAILLAKCLVIDQMGEIKRYSSGEIIKVDIER